MYTRSKATPTAADAEADADGSNSDSDANATAVNIGAQGTTTQSQVNVGSDAIASLVASIASLRTSVQELRNETSRSQADLQQLRQRIKIDSVNVTSNAPLSNPQLTQLPLSAAPPPLAANNNILTDRPLLYQRPQPSNALTFIEGSAAKLFPLPAFDGNPEDWPLFFASYVDTTAEFGYSNRQNLMRLQKALQGNAKRAVTSMLMFPDDVSKVIEELQFNFGRPDLLIRAQLQRVQQFPVIHDNRLDQILEFSNRVRNITSFFNSAKCEHHLQNPTLLEQLISKLPPSKQFEWSKHASQISPFPTVVTFGEWLSDLAKVVSIMPGVADISLRFNQPSLPTQRQNNNPSRQSGSSGGPVRRVMHSREEQHRCLCCSQSHVLTTCRKFGSLDCAARWEFVKEHRLCFGCLKSGHGLHECRHRKTCDINGCKRMHHQLLHQSSRTLPQSNAERERVLNCRRGNEVSLLKIFPVHLIGPLGNVKVYAMFDEGSSVSLLDEDVAIQLGLRGRAMPLTLQWYGDSQTTESSRIVSLDVKGVNSRRYPLKSVHAIKGLNLPRQSFNKSGYAHLRELPVENYSEVKPVLLLGLDNCHLSMPIKTITARYDQPVAINTKLGWVVYGPHCHDNAAVPRRVLYVRKSNALSQLNRLVEEYFSVENFGVRSNVALESECTQRARKVLADTTKDLGGRYEVGLLWREERVNLPPSYAMAKQRLVSIESRMQRDAQFADSYNREIAKYVDKGYAKQLTPVEADYVGPTTWYLPHFGVTNPHKPQKLRIVFDAAAIANGTSLNKELLKGPEQAQSLVTIIHKFRQGIIAVAGDIEEMFSRVRIRDIDQDSQRFLWRDGDPKQPIRVYKMTTMIFGAICSPCCAEHIKNLNAGKFQSTMPRGSRAIIENTYVDDLVMSFGSANEAIEVISEAVKINAAADFKLRNFISNNKSVQQKLNGVCGSNSKAIMRMERQATTEKVLGMFWNTASDGLEFHFRFHNIGHDVLNNIRPPSKRELLGIVMSMYDPFGFLANTTICLKLLVQELWKLGVQWDDPIPNELADRWSKWWKNGQFLKRLSVPRCYSTILLVADNVQLHIFVDASVSAYAAVAYLRIKKRDRVDVAMVCAKARCAPLKGLTIPRLELQAAVLGCRLRESLERCHDFRVNSTTFWTDSKTVVLSIRSTSRSYKQFVAFRVAEILSTTSANQWCWIPTSLNVADEATRASTSCEYSIKSRWFAGPEFLREDESSWPQEIPELTSDKCAIEEVAKRVIVLNKGEYPINFTNFYSYFKIIRVLAWMLRFSHNAKSPGIRSGELSSAELAAAENKILRRVQFESFSEEIQTIKQNRSLPKSSSLYQLTPFMDDDGLLKVNGRIDAAYCLPITARRPIILPQNHYLTRLVVKKYHCQLHHQNDSLTINEIRQRFWVPRARALLKSVKRECSVCICNAAKPEVPLMGQLPIDRLTPYVRPFSYAGVDYCGPFFVTIGRRREKRWVGLFTCLTTRAVHLEIAADLSTDSFILCLRNFVNRRGVPSRIRSDNGTNFVGAQKELKAEEHLFDFNAIKSEMACRNIEWIFNCPANPSAGGCWERLVQCTKRLLQRVLREEAPRLETFHSVLLEAENIINSRLLTELAVTAQDEEPLTPNHFLLGCLNSTQTPSTTEEKVCLRKQWRIAQNLKDRLWKRWTAEYLPQLLRRCKWREHVTPLQPGQLVIICDSAQPRSQWERGRVVDVFVGKDGQVRSAAVRTASGVIRRPTSKLAALHISESS